MLLLMETCVGATGQGCTVQPDTRLWRDQLSSMGTVLRRPLVAPSGCSQEGPFVGSWSLQASAGDASCSTWWSSRAGCCQGILCREREPSRGVAGQGQVGWCTLTNSILLYFPAFRDIYTTAFSDSPALASTSDHDLPALCAHDVHHVALFVPRYCVHQSCSSLPLHRCTLC